jgi:hypothetical protein
VPGVVDPQYYPFAGGDGLAGGTNIMDLFGSYIPGIDDMFTFGNDTGV